MLRTILSIEVGTWNIMKRFQIGMVTNCKTFAIGFFFYYTLYGSVSQYGPYLTDTVFVAFLRISTALNCIIVHCLPGRYHEQHFWRFCPFTGL